MAKFGFYQWEHKNNNFYMFLQKQIWESPDKRIIYWTCPKGLDKWQEKPQEELVHESISLRDMGRICSKMAQKFLEVGIRENDHVVILLPLGLHSILSIYALLKIAAIPVIIDRPHFDEDLKLKIGKIQPRAIISFKKIYEEVIFESHLKSIPLKIIVGEPGEHEFTGRIEQFMRGKIEADTIPLVQDHKCMLFLGTGKKHYFGIKTCKQMAAQNFHMKEALGIQPHDVYYTPFTLYALHLIAMGVPITLPVALPPGNDELELSATFAQINAVCLNSLLVDTEYLKNLYTHVANKKRSLPLIEKIHSENNPIQKEFGSLIRKLSPDSKLSLMFGQMDADPLTSVDYYKIVEGIKSGTLAFPKQESGFLGKLHKNINYKIIRPTAEKIEIEDLSDWPNWEVAPGEEGELLVAAEHITTHYFNGEAELPENKIMDDFGIVWHRTGEKVLKGIEDDWFWHTGKIT